MPHGSAIHSTPLREREFERILLIKPSAVGDVIHTIPVLAKLRARYPSARIDWLLTPSIAELVGRHPALSNVVLFSRRATGPWWKGGAIGHAVALLAQLRSARYDLVIDLHGQARSALFSLATGSRVRIGFDRPRPRSTKVVRRTLTPEAYAHGWTGAREFAWTCYTRRIEIPTLDVHAVDRYLWIAPILGLDDGPPDFHIPIPAGARSRVAEMLESDGWVGEPIAMLTPGTVWETKHWRADGFASVARRLIASGWRVVLAGSAGDRARCAEVKRACPAVLDWSGRTSLTEMAALTSRAGLCLTNDSGPMHLAAALGRPVVSVFGPTDPVWVGPYGQARSVVRVELPCAPCYLRRLSDCPHDHACMNRVSADDVWRRIEEIVRPASRRAGVERMAAAV